MSILKESLHTVLVTRACSKPEFSRWVIDDTFGMPHSSVDIVLTFHSLTDFYYVIYLFIYFTHSEPSIMFFILSIINIFAVCNFFSFPVAVVGVIPKIQVFIVHTFIKM